LLKNPLHKSVPTTSYAKVKFLDVEKTSSQVDVQLWQDFQTGSESAFAAIYEKNVGLLYSYGIKIVSDKDLVKDSIQDLFIELWDAKNRISKVNSIKAYLCKSLRRKLIASVSKQRKTFDKSQDLEKLNPTVFSSEVSLIEKQRFDEQRKMLNKELDSLTLKQKEIIHLKFYGRLNYNEIAEVMLLDKKATYNLMARTIKILKKCLRRFS